MRPRNCRVPSDQVLANVLCVNRYRPPSEGRAGLAAIVEKVVGAVNVGTQAQQSDGAHVVDDAILEVTAAPVVPVVSTCSPMVPFRRMACRRVLPGDMDRFSEMLAWATPISV